jgi:hypothetical protein
VRRAVVDRAVATMTWLSDASEEFRMSTAEPPSPIPPVLFHELWAGLFQQADAQGRAILEWSAVLCDRRTVQRLWLESLSQVMDSYLRSPAFFESMRAGLEIMTKTAVFQTELYRDFAGRVGAPLASDVHEVSERLRRAEDILLSELKAIENRLGNIEKNTTPARDVD